MSYEYPDDRKYFKCWIYGRVRFEQLSIDRSYEYCGYTLKMSRFAGGHKYEFWYNITDLEFEACREGWRWLMAKIIWHLRRDVRNGYIS